MAKHYALLDIVNLVVRGCWWSPVLAQLENLISHSPFDSMGVKSRSSASSAVVTNNAVELVTGTKGLGMGRVGS